MPLRRTGNGDIALRIRKLGTGKWQPLYRVDKGKGGILKVCEKFCAIAGN